MLENIFIAFLAGLTAPLAAVCILPLYPAFLSYLASQTKHKSNLVLALIITAGIITSMFLLGLIFVFFLQESLSKVIGIVSPIAFFILAIVSVGLIVNYKFPIPAVRQRIFKNPYVSSFWFGFFFGFIVLPCNPASLVVLFAISSTTTDFVVNLLSFVGFGIGMAVPLLVLAVLPSKKFISFMTKNIVMTNRLVGWSLLVVALYYLLFVFDVLSLGLTVPLKYVATVWLAGLYFAWRIK